MYNNSIYLKRVIQYIQKYFKEIYGRKGCYLDWFKSCAALIRLPTKAVIGQRDGEIPHV
jgi:hypothetical protein